MTLDPRRGRSWSARLLLVLPTLAVLPLGGGPPAARAAVAGLSLLASVVLLLGVRRAPVPPGLPRLGWAAVGLVAGGALALLPVHRAARALLQPGLAPLVAAVQDAALHDGAPLPLTLLSRRTALEVASWASTLTLLLAVGSYARHHRARRAVADGLVLAAMATVVVELVHSGLGIQAIYGSYAPAATELHPPFGPFANANHGALLLAAALPIALRMIEARDPLRAALGAGATLLLLAGMVLAGSRGAPLAAGAGVLVALLLGGGRRVRRAAVGGIVLAALATPWLSRLAAHDRSLQGRFGIWRDAAELVRTSPWAGTGPGAFEAGYRTVRTDRAYASAAHAHCEPLEALAEAGVPLGLLAIGIGLWPLVGGARAIAAHPTGRRRRSLAALAGAATSLAVGGLYGFPARIGALQVAWALVAGTLAYAAHLPRQREDERRLRPPGRFLLPVGALLASGAVGLGLLGLTRGPRPSPLADPGALREAADATWEAQHDPAATEPLLVAGLRAAPLDALLLLRLARVRAARGEREAALELVRLASRVDPTLPWAWITRARVAERLGLREEAIEAWRRALDLNLPPELDQGALVDEALDAGGRDPLAVLPERLDRRRVAAERLALRGRADLAEAILARDAARDRRSRAVHARLLVRWRRPEEALALLAGAPEGCAELRVRAMALEALGRLQEAEATWSAALGSCGAHQRAIRMGLARTRLALGHPSAGGMIEKLVEQDPDDPDARELQEAWREAGGAPVP